MTRLDFDLFRGTIKERSKFYLKEDPVLNRQTL